MKSTRLSRIVVGLMTLVLALALAPAITEASPAPAPASDYVTGCTGQYFNNTTLTGSPVLVRTDPAINFFWPEGTSPAPGLNVSQYGVRWNCSINVPVAGTYTFTMVADDGMNLVVDGNLLIWAWYDQGPSTYSNPIYLAAGLHNVTVEYYNDTLGGTAQVYSDITTAGAVPYYPAVPSVPYYPPVPAPVYPAPTVSGYLGNCIGQYFNNATLSGYPVFTRQDPALNFYWPSGTTPGAGLNPSYYSVRWTCVVNVPATRNYIFTLVTDDGMNLVVDNNWVVNAWRDQSTTTYSQSVYLSAGTHTIRVDYYNATVNGVAQVTIQ